MDKQDLTFNKPQGSICHTTQTTKPIYLNSSSLSLSLPLFIYIYIHII